MGRLGAVVISLSLVAGCGADELNASTNSKTQEVPVVATGTVSGQVLTTAMKPLAEVTVRLTANTNAVSTTTDEEGYFSFATVPAGSEVLVTVTKAGYASVRTTAFVPASAGQFPLANGNARVGPVVLAALNGTLKFNVLDSTGRPATGAKARLEADPSGSVFDGQALTAVVSDSSVDASGGLTFTGIPDPLELMQFDGTYTLWVNPVDANLDGTPELKGRALRIRAQELIADSTPRTVLLEPVDGWEEALTVEAGNVGSLFGHAAPTDNLVRPGEPVRLVFSAPLEMASLLVRLTDEHALEELPVTTEISAGNVLLITPVQAPKPGSEYNLMVRVVSKNGETFNGTGFFFGDFEAAAPALEVVSIRYQETGAESALLNPGETVYVEFNQVLKQENVGHDEVEFFFATDINSDDTVGTVQGEVGHERGFPLTADEPTRPLESTHPEAAAVFPIKKSGYTTRFKFTYAGAKDVDPKFVEVAVDFDMLRERASELYVTAWNAPATGRFTSDLASIPPPAP